MEGETQSTLTQEAGGIIYRLSEVWDEWADKTGQGSGEFIPQVFGGIWRSGRPGADYAAELDQWHTQREDIQPLALFQALFTACAYAVQAMKADKGGDEPAGWRHLSEANYWLGIVVGAWSLRREMSPSISDVARKAADSRHAENRAMKAQVLEWYERNAQSFNSKDEAASEAAGKIVPVTFRTVRNWLNKPKAKK